jgi:hypothetical protein
MHDDKPFPEGMHLLIRRMNKAEAAALNHDAAVSAIHLIGFGFVCG